MSLESANSGQRAGPGSKRNSQAAVLSHGPSRRSAVQPPCRRRGRHHDDAADSRKEIDLVPPVPLPVEPKPSERKPEMPVPLCPMGAVTSETPDPAEPPPPGTSPLDNGMRRVMDAFQPAGISANTTGDVALNAGEVVVLVVRHQPISQPRLPRLVQAACDPRSRPTMPPAARPFRCPFGHPES